VYTSLDRIDIVTKNKETGREGYVLTDHREPAEISAERELSILYALTRVTAAKVMGAREGGADVTYVCAAAPPDFLREAVASAGASLTVGVQASTPPHPTRAVGELADAAFRGLARRVAEREGVAVDAALLQRLEDATLHSPPQKDEDEPAFWARTLELAAVCGELLRTKTGGQWTESTDMNGLFPFAFTAGNATINVADKAHRFMDQGESQRPAQLLLMADDLDRTEEGQLMVNLKPGDFPRERGVCRDLLEGSGPVDARMPIVFLGRDQPNTFAYLSPDSPDIEKSFAEALANLARLDLEPVLHDIAGIQVHVVSDHFYASEKILDVAFMKRMQRRLGAELLAAAVPYKGVLLVTDQVVPPAIAGFAAAAAGLFGNSGGAPALSPVVFLVKDGKVVGHLETESKKPETQPQKQGFWSRLFGGH